MQVKAKKASRISTERKIAYLTRAADIAVRVFPHILAAIRPGVTEKDIARLIAKKIREYGGEKLSFPTLVASGERSALIHGKPTQKKLRIGDQILLDYGAVYKGYHSDISRTVFLGTMTAKQKKIYTIVLKAQQRAEKKLKAGADCAVIDSYARNFITRAGFGKRFPHSTGHGLGLVIHDTPRIGKKSEEKLKKGDIVTIEPGIYINGWGGIRIEDDHVITQKGAVCLTDKAEKNKAVIIPVRPKERTVKRVHL